MRKIIIGAALLLGGALLTTSTPAQAAVGCLCGKIGAPAVCVATITDCNLKMGGVCVLACDYTAPKAKKGKVKKAKAMKSKAKKSKKM
jgi:hypothetical protein